jgi:hypothetical protein
VIRSGEGSALVSTETACDPGVIARCRELLGEEAAGLSDAEVDSIRIHAEAIAHMLIKAFLETRSTQT